MSDLQVMLRIRADGSGASATLRNAKGEVVELGQEATRTGARMQTGLRQGEDAAKALSAEFDRLRRSVIGAAVIGTTTALVANFAREIVNAGNAFNGFNAGLTAATGSQRAAGQEMAFVRAEAERLGLDLQSAAKAYTGITAAARGTVLEGQATRDIFSGVAEAARVGNLSAAEMAGALTAIQQIMSKGVVSAEELRGQLGERLSSAFRIAAQSMGVTEAELNKMLETGSLTADEFLPKFAAGLRDAAAAGLALSTNSPAADFERLGNAIGNLQNAIAQAGVLDALAAGARDLTKEINALVASGALPTLVSTLGTLAQLGVAAVIFRIVEAARAAGAAKAVQIKQTLAAVAAERAQLAASAQSAAAQVADIQATLRAVEAARAEEVAKLRAAQADIAAAQATIAATNAIGAQSAALRANRIATEELAAAKARMTAATTALATLGAQQARLTAAETVAIGTQTAAQTALAGAATRTGAAIGMLKTAGAGLVALLGGPWVAGLLGVYGAYLAVNAATEDAEEFTERLSVRLQQGRDSWSAYTAAMNESRAAYRAANPEIIQRELERNNVLLAQAQERADEGGASAALYADKVRILSDRQRELTAELEKANPALAEQAKSLVASQEAIDKVIAGAQERVTQLRRQIAETQGGLRGGLLFDLQELSRTGIAGSADATREQRDAIRELLADLPRLEAQLKATRAATRESNTESREAARVARTWAESDRELANAKRPLWEAIQREQEARYQLADMLRDADRDLDNEIALAGLTGRARAELANAISAENFARQVNLASIQAGRPLAAEEIEFIRRNTEARLNARDAIEEATAAQERANAELARFADSYLSQATDAIGEFVAGGMRDWKDMWDSFKDIAKRAVADIVSQLLRQKIVVPIVAQLTGQGGAGGALGGIGNILGGLGSIFGGGAGGAAPGGGLGGILGGIGGLFGLGGGAFAGATAAGAAGVAGGAFSGAVASGAAGLGGALGGIASVLGPIGLAIGAISLLRNVFGSNKPPDIRLGAVGQTRKPEVTFGTDLGQFQAGVRGGPDRDSIVRAVTEFDRGIAQIIGSIQGGSDQLDVIRSRLASWSVDLRGSAATAENVLGSRWQAILSTFPEDIQAIVRSAGDLQEQVQALGQVLAMPAQVQGILGDLRREFDLAGMSELERQTFIVNERFDALREQLTALRATQEQLAEVETFRTQALAALTGATNGAGAAIDDLSAQLRDYAGFVAGLQAEAATAGLSDFQREMVAIQVQMRENIARANELARAAGLQGAREEDLALIHQLAAQSAANAMAQLRDSARDLVEQLYSLTATPPSVREYADFIAGFATEAANSGLNDFQREMVGIEVQMRANIARANDLARAAGLQGARERDLALIHQQAAAAAAVAMAQLRASGRSIVAQLYGDANAGAQQLTQPFTQAAAAASGSLSRITDELRQFADGLRLGDLSPLNQREQLAEAMRQLREASGAGDQQRVQQIARETLQIGRGLFATGSDYRELFDQVDAIVRATVPSATGGPGGGGGPVAEAARQVSAIERAQLAQQLAQITADSAAASGDTFAQVAEDLGFTLEQLARDLGLDQAALTSYLESLQVDTASVAEEVTSAADRIVAAIREQAIAGLTNSAERARIAAELAQITADLASASGDSFAEVADALGFNLERLARDLGLDQAALQTYLESLQIDAVSIADEITTATDRIVAAIREAATATPANPAAPGTPGATPGTTPATPTTPASPGPPPGATPLSPNGGGTPGEPIPVQPVEPPGGGIVGGELRRLSDLVERLLVERRNDQAATLALQGRVEQLTAQMADALAEVADGGGRIR